MRKNTIGWSSAGASALAVSVVWFGAGTCCAQNPPEAKPGWRTTAAAGLTLTRGNRSSFLGTLSLDTTRKWPRDEVRLGIAGAYGEVNSVESQKMVSGYGQWNHLFTERLYGGVRLDGLYDGIAGVDYRLKASPLLGYYAVHQPRTTLTFEAGPSVVFEKLKAVPERTYAALRLGERFEHKLTETTRLWQSLEYVARVDDWDRKFILTGELGIDAAITRQLSLRTVLQDIYDNAPAPGRKRNDIRLISGVAYKF